MTNRGLVVLGIRLFSLFIALQALLSPLQPHTQAHALASDPTSTASAWVGLSLCLIVAGLLWIYVGRLADLVLPTRRGYSVAHGSAITANDAQAIAYSAVGLYLIADSLPHIVITSWPLLSSYSQPDGSIVPLGLAADTIRLTLGASLFLGARGLAGLVRQLRRAPAR
ncbi:MAG TPA: hypothetical protein VFL97_06225 [Nitrococcus sp.]|nr:hypothetical protein [Nitrococcus sp.]